MSTTEREASPLTLPALTDAEHQVRVLAEVLQAMNPVSERSRYDALFDTYVTLLHRQRCETCCAARDPESRPSAELVTTHRQRVRALSAALRELDPFADREAYQALLDCHTLISRHAEEGPAR